MKKLNEEFSPPSENGVIKGYWTGPFTVLAIRFGFERIVATQGLYSALSLMREEYDLLIDTSESRYTTNCRQIARLYEQKYGIRIDPYGVARWIRDIWKGWKGGVDHSKPAGSPELRTEILTRPIWYDEEKFAERSFIREVFPPFRVHPTPNHFQLKHTRSKPSQRRTRLSHLLERTLGNMHDELQ